MIAQSVCGTSFSKETLYKILKLPCSLYFGGSSYRVGYVREKDFSGDCDQKKPSIAIYNLRLVISYD